MRILALGEFNISRNFLIALTKAGHQVTYGHVGKPQLPEAAPDLDVLAVPRGDRLDWLRALIGDVEPDLLYVGSAGYDGSNAIAKELLDADFDIPLVRVYKEFLIQAAEREGAVLTRSDGVVLHSEAAAGYFRALYGLDRDRVHLFDHDVVAGWLVPDEVPTRKLSDDDGEPHVVLGGTMKDDGSGYDYRELIAGLAARRIHVHVYPVGHSRWLSPGRVLDPDSAQVRSAYDELWRLPYVHREEPLPQPDMVPTWSRYDLGIMQVAPRKYVPHVTPWQQMDHPSKHSFYLAAGLPIAVDRGWLHSLREKLAPYDVVVDYSDLDELAEAVRNRAALAERAANARRHRAEWPIEAGLPALLDFLTRITAGRPARAAV